MSAPEATTVVITRAGVVTPAGRTEDHWTNVVEGRATPQVTTFCFGDRERDLPTFRADTAFDPLAYFRKPELHRMDRVHILAGAAVSDLLDGHPLGDGTRTAIIVGMAVGVSAYLEAQYLAARTRFTSVNPFAAPVSMASSVASQLAQRFAVHGPTLTVNTACASGAAAIALGVAMIRAGEVDRVIAGGVDAPLTDPVMSFFARMDAVSERTDPLDHACCPFDAGRTGFVPGEGAAFVLLESLAEAEAGGCTALAAVTGTASTTDGHHPVMPHPDGTHALAAVRGALRRAGREPDEIASVNSHGTSTPRNDAIEAAVLDQVFGRRLPVTATKGMTGHMLGASGAFEALIAAHTARTGIVPPTAGTRDLDPAIGQDIVTGVARAGRPGPVLSTSFGFGGQNTALVLEPPA